jgi:hypothetical protein
LDVARDGDRDALGVGEGPPDPFGPPAPVPIKLAEGDEGGDAVVVNDAGLGDGGDDFARPAEHTLRAENLGQLIRGVDTIL